VFYLLEYNWAAYIYKMWKIREITDIVTNVVMNYTEVEAKVREATNEDPWGPQGSLMQEIAQCTFTYESFPEVMGMLWKRMLQDNKKQWRRTYKALLLLGYLLKNGSERVVTSAREHVYDLRSLENYTSLDENGKDQGVNVRQRVKDLIDFIQNDDRLREERKKAKKNKDKYVGMSSDMMGYRYSFPSGDSYDMDSPKRYDGDIDEWDRENKDSFTNNKSRFSRHRSYEDVSDSKSERQEGDESRGKSSPDSLSYRDEQTDKKPTRVNTVHKIDLGAAATFGKDQKPSEVEKKSTNSELLGELAPSNTQSSLVDDDFFDPRAAEDCNVPAKQNNFADFSSFNAPNNASTNDEFADFTSFSQPVTNNNPPALNSSNLFGELSSTSFNPLSNQHPTEQLTSAPSITSASSLTGIFPSQMPGMAPASNNLLGLGMTVPPGPSLVPGFNPSPVGQQPGLFAPSPTQQPGLSPQSLYSPVPTQQQRAASPMLGMNPPMQTSPQPFLQGVSSGGMVPMQPLIPTSSQQLPPAFNQSGGQKQTSQNNSINTSKDQKKNTWSNAGSVNIDLDNLLTSSRQEKPTPPSMNQLAGVAQGMQQLNLHGTPPHPNQTGLASPTGFAQFPGMYGAQPNYGNMMK